jgi:hypothetical protein
LLKVCKTENCSGEDSLNKYLESVRHKPFEWGVHDCVQFTKGAVKAQTNRDIDLPHYSSIRGAISLCKTICLVSELDKMFDRCNHIPPIGSIVAVGDTYRTSTGPRLGVVVSDKAAFVSPNGLVFSKLRPETDLYWIVK